jgi:hypothetical protein
MTHEIPVSSRYIRNSSVPVARIHPYPKRRVGRTVVALPPFVPPLPLLARAVPVREVEPRYCDFIVSPVESQQLESKTA